MHFFRLAPTFLFLSLRVESYSRLALSFVQYAIQSMLGRLLPNLSVAFPFSQKRIISIEIMASPSEQRGDGGTLKRKLALILKVRAF